MIGSGEMKGGKGCQRASVHKKKQKHCTTTD